MRGTLIALAITLLASTALTADRNTLPAQFVGIGASTIPGMTKPNLDEELLDVAAPNYERNRARAVSGNARISQP
jgi:hypothetical protein